MSAGIDYGRGLANVDHATGIRYGVISPHTPNPEATQDIWTSGENLTHAAAVDAVKDQIRLALSRVLVDDFDIADAAQVEEHVSGIWGDVEDRFNDRYEESEDTYRYEAEGYVLETSSLGIYVIRSPYYTTARFCSPCCPGAGDLDAFEAGGVKTYCLGHDWFEEEKAPYRVWQVEDDQEVRRP
jgi:hypothetical protein